VGQPRSRHSDPCRSRMDTAAKAIRVSAALALAGGLVTACAKDEPAPERVAAPIRTSFPAATAGGACALFDYDAIEKAIGVRFDVSASSRSGQTDTCVVQPEQDPLPDLTLAISKTSADAEIFKDDVVPDKGATALKGLGLAAYQAPVAAAKGSGAGLEICWLAKDKRLMSLRLTPAVGAEPPGKAFATKLVGLAKQVEAGKPKPAAAG
jgi:hypothetical protein